MTEWITLQQAADIIGVRKGTLCMWRLRDRFPFESKGKGRGLLVDEDSVKGWVAAGGKAGVRPGRPAKKKAGRPAKKKVGRPAKKKVGRPAKKKAGRPPKVASGRKPGRPPGRRPGRPPKAVAATRQTSSAVVTLRTEAGLNEIQQFVAAVKEGRNIQVSPSKGGYVMTLEK
jgi:hypothetical protein